MSSHIANTLGTLAQQTVSHYAGGSQAKQAAQPTTATTSGSTATAQNKTCYLVISPNPRSGYYVSDANIPGKLQYFIKIGDGNFRDAYFVSNPSFDYEENDHAPNYTMGTPPVRPGKYLEKQFFHSVLADNQARHISDSGSSEWHTIATSGPAPQGTGPGSLDHFKSVLVKLLDEFPTYDFTPTHLFHVFMLTLLHAYVLED